MQIGIRFALLAGLAGGIVSCVGCRSQVPTGAKLVGAYRYRDSEINSSHAPEFLFINTDGSFVQFYGTRDSPKASSNEGHWVLNPEPRTIFLYNFKRWEKNDPPPVASGAVTNFNAGVEVRGDHVSIVLSDDLGQEFVKVSGALGTR